MTLATALRVRASELTHRTFAVPLLLFYPTSRCNSRCLSCDWWRSTGSDDLTLEEIEVVTRSLDGLGTRTVVFSGGEPLLRPDVFSVADLFAERRVRLELLTSGVLLHRHARDVASRFSRVTLSLDAADRELYEKVRGLDALARIEEGVERLRELSPRMPITARSTLHRLNYRELPRLIEKARDMGLDGISFLAADLSSSAFGRREPPSGELRLAREEISELADVIERVIVEEAAAFRSGFIAEPEEKLRRLPAYYAALLGDGPFPPVSCNAPWVSAVVEANGAVRPCFFHPPIGSVREAPLDRILREDLPSFRRGLSVRTDPVCERCVCSIRFRPGVLS